MFRLRKNYVFYCEETMIFCIYFEYKYSSIYNCVSICYYYSDIVLSPLKMADASKKFVSFHADAVTA